jgi:hypothetical protein
MNVFAMLDSVIPKMMELRYALHAIELALHALAQIQINVSHANQKIRELFLLILIVNYS